MTDIPAAQSHRPTILAIDDDPDFLLMLADVLRDAGYAVLMATGTEILASTCRETVDLILLDLNLAGMSGVELGCHLRRHPRLADVPIVAMSGCHHLLQRGRFAFPAVAQLVKPLDLAELFNTVATHVA